MLITDIDTINKRFANQLQLWLEFIIVLYNDAKLKRNSAKITAKAAMQDPRAIVQNKFKKQGALASMTGTATTTPQVRNLIGRPSENKRAARAARTYEQVRAVLCKTTT